MAELCKHGNPVVWCRICQNTALACCPDPKDALISSLRSQVAALTAALGKAEEALKEAESNMGWANSMIHEGVEFYTVREVLHSAQKDGLKASANICAALSLISAARQAATGTGPDIRPEGPHSASPMGLLRRSDGD